MVTDQVTTVASSTGASVDPASDAPRLQRGTAVGRYVVLELIGVGGMGVVYAAFDPEVDRKLAIKLLRDDADSGATDKAHRRLLREARALGKLSHPNVVTVHDVGEHDGQVFLAMEYVDGRTVSRWVAETKPDWRQVVAVFRAAGEGLAAAHAAGLVHRDFKPDNVMVDGSGRVRVMDFGLALAVRDMARAAARDPAALSEGDPASTHSQQGRMSGTPAYMSPEQHLGLGAEAPSDQFSFCAALYEALYGKRPFEGDTALAIAAAVVEGRRAPPGDAALPGWLRRVVLRGLEVDADARWPSMRALLGEIDRRLARPRLLWAVAGLAVVGAVSSALALAPGERTACNARAELDDVWPGRATAVRGAFDRSDRSYAKDVWPRLEAGLDHYVGRWVAERDATCRRVNADLHDRAVRCLQGRRGRLSALVDVLAEGEPVALASSLAAVARLPHPEPCGDAEFLSRDLEPPTDPGTIAATEAVAAELRMSQALADAGLYARAKAVAESTYARASQVDYPPIVARAAGQLAAVRLELREDAFSQAEDAFFLAREAGDPDAALSAALSLAMAAAFDPSKRAEAQRWMRHARVLANRVGQVEDEFEFLVIGATARDAQGEYEAALTGYRRAADLARDEFGLDDPRYADALMEVGGVLQRVGRADEAVYVLQEALEIEILARGPEHPFLGQTYQALGNAQEHSGDLDGAISSHERALAILRAAYGPRHSLVALALNDLGLARASNGDYPRAAALLEESLALKVETLGRDHSEVGGAHNNLGYNLYLAQRYAEALPHYEQALAIKSAATPGHPELVFPLLGLTRCHFELGDVDKAVARGEEALALAEQSELSPTLVAAVRFALARALGRGKPRAEDLAKRARAAFQAAERDEPLAEIDAWLGGD